ncbi:LOW QUALITY PROTEIN: protein FAM111A-like [Mus pahari]|uniref:LOW QUALITY PROTEIN: protein FAM111A-like n=1 Tax=Mus pahari TaxID=10093 RepID=UPI000A30FDCE|nr:LOW QUALITY PROTEIN: protein FAM111A-like [Mus pahari]
MRKNQQPHQCLVCSRGTQWMQRRLPNTASMGPKEEQSDCNIYQIKMESRKRASEVTNLQNQCEYSLKKCRQDQTYKTIVITLDGNQWKNEKMKYALTHKKADSLYAALNTLSAVKNEIESQQDKEMLVCGKEGIKGYINLSIPLCCFPEDSHMVITFSKTEKEQREDKPVYRWQDHECTDCVKFYIHAVGKRNERILKCRELHQEENKLCMYGSKGDSIKETLRKDGRFYSSVESDDWKLIQDLDTIIENTQPVDELEGKLFQVELERIKCPQAADPIDLEEPSYRKLKEYIVDKYPILKRECKKLRAYIKEGSQRTSSFEMHKENFRKLTKNSTLAKVLKLLSHFSDSVGLIIWNNGENEGCVTCFVFTGLYILTCLHVINDIVGEGIEQSKWEDIISQCVKVTFDYEEFLEKKSFFVEPWFEISDYIIDYAVVKLKGNGQEPAGLYNGITPVPSSGLIYIIGHPDVKQELSDGCVVISQDEHIQERKGVKGHNTMQYIYIYTQRSFQETVHEPGDHTFYCGSSGSPVFDSKGSLVAMHTAGFICEYESGVSSIVEFGPSMECIIIDIKQKHKTWYDEECVNQQEVEMKSQDY